MTRRPLLLASLLFTTPVFAFGEDLCFAANGTAPLNCQPLPAGCAPGDASTACKSAALSAVADAKGQSNGGRSLVHVDATYVLAQAVGFTPISAYWIAAYDEATDLGTFAPRTLTGAPATDATALTTKSISGVTRGDFDHGGVLFHFVTPRNGGAAYPDPSVDGLHPDATDTDEVLLANLRPWALQGQGAGRGCTGGLTVPTSGGNYALGPLCYQWNSQPGVVSGSLAAVGPFAVPFSAPTGPQVIDVGTGVLSTGFDAYIGTYAAEARAGIYLHTLADRISHHVCTDASTSTGPVGLPRTFTVDMSNAECVQTLHVLRHVWETGTDFSALPARERTTEAALDEVFDALLELATARGLASGPTSQTQALKTQLVAELSAALETYDAQDRALAVRDVGCDRGYAVLPGMPACVP
ncbi:hypothetical protein [Corallococcus terminator]|uniref:Uncharacterized protein n=1 Tax=Corallococcus terminator TaxID=2316733 RepID=A0A3A8JE71_9BACT|nr:hypothetical protein [Corallococcus terminator]RKG88801.1 hypothetical protein D7V88_13615 [Corallococcus terminator]